MTGVQTCALPICIKLPIAERAEIRERFLALLFWMHPGVEDEALAGRFEVITVRADFGAAREIDEFQTKSLALTPALALSKQHTHPVVL